MMQRVSIRICERCDLEKIAEIEKECIEDGWSLKAFEEWFDPERNFILAAEIEDRIIGFANAGFVLDEGELLNIAVLKEYRRQKIAELLFKEIEKKLAEKEVKTIFLEVREKNKAAVSLYLKHGFEQNGLRKNYYKNPADNGILMMKKI